jgi:hypothetical protein
MGARKLLRPSLREHFDRLGCWINESNCLSHWNGLTLLSLARALRDGLLESEEPDNRY